MAGFVLAEVTNKSINVHNEGMSIQNPFVFGKENNLFPNYPDNVNDNPFWVGSALRHKSFGAICVGRNNVAYFVTRVSNGHGRAGANLYWSSSKDEGETWDNFTQFTQDTAADDTEDLRDCNLYYDTLLDMYFLIYVHQTNITNNNWDNVVLRLKVYMGREPFVNMYDISPGIIPIDEVTGSEAFTGMQTFETFHRLGNDLYLPAYRLNINGDRSSGYNSVLLKLYIADMNNIETAISYSKWTTVKKWEDEIGVNETTFYITYNNYVPRMNLLSRQGGQYSYHYYSDDGGETWTEKQPVGFETGGGPRVFELNGGYMLIAREQAHGANSATTYAMFSNDGVTWSGRIKIGNAATGYGSVAQFKSGKTLVCYSQEYNGIGLQIARQMFQTP